MKGFYSDSILDSSIAFRDTMLTKHSLAFSISHHFFLISPIQNFSIYRSQIFFFFEKSLSYSIMMIMMTFSIHLFFYYFTIITLHFIEISK